MWKGQSLPRKSQNLSVYGSVCVFVSAGDIGEWGDVGVGVTTANVRDCSSFCSEST
jgi:hypothetical protein